MNRVIDNSDAGFNCAMLFIVVVAIAIIYKLVTSSESDQ